MSRPNVPVPGVTVTLAGNTSPGQGVPKMFPLQAGYRDAKSDPHPLQIPWSVAEKAYCAYVRRHGRGQSLERLAERGGFDGAEMDMLYPPWREEVSELTALRQRVRELEAELVAEREAVRVLARYMYENGRGCGNRTYTERLDDLQVHFSNVIANPLAAAAVRRAGGEE